MCIFSIMNIIRTGHNPTNTHARARINAYTPNIHTQGSTTSRQGHITCCWYLIPNSEFLSVSVSMSASMSVCVCVRLCVRCVSVCVFMCVLFCVH